MVSKILSCDTEKPFVFISYSKRDAERVYPLVLTLQDLGCNIWIDRELNKMVGKNWQIGALGALSDAGCRAVLFMISESSLKSVPVLAELIISQKAPKVLRKHGGEPVRIIPINADPEWSQRKTGLATWIKKTVSQDSKILTSDDRACLDIGDIMDKYTAKGSVSYIEEKGEIAQAILDDVLEPLGGGKLTIADIQDVAVICQNIDRACFCRKDNGAGRPAGEAQKAQTEIQVINFPDGTYQGETLGGKRNGSGRMVYSSGNIYEGTWKDDQLDGSGTMTYKSGAVYTGSYKAGKRHGKGRYTYANGKVYEGDFFEGTLTGKGVMRKPNGEVYEGHFVDGKFSGHGKYTFADGSVREGEWKDDRPL